jgi:hypothetical protein
MGGNNGGSGPTVQQQQLETEQATQNANLNLEENSQRKSILNAMLGTRVFRGSALSRALRGNTPGAEPQGAPSASQNNNQVVAPAVQSLIDTQETRGSGATTAGGAGASGAAGGASRLGGYAGGGSAGGIGKYR